MKKLSLAILTLLSTGLLSALPVANPIQASLYTSGIWCSDTRCNPCDPCGSWLDAFNLRVGFWGDYVFNRHMEGRSNQESVEQFSIYKNEGVVTLNYCNWIDLYGLVGVANFSQANTLTPNFQTVEYEASVCYGAGLRATLWECGCFGMGVEIQYFGSQPVLESFTDYTSGTVNYPSDSPSGNYNEAQLGIGAAYRVETGYGNALVPYIAVKFARSIFEPGLKSAVVNAVSFNQNNLQSSKYAGYAVGMTATVCERGAVTVEGRFADEKAVFVNGEIRF